MVYQHGTMLHMAGFKKSTALYRFRIPDLYSRIQGINLVSPETFLLLSIDQWYELISYQAG